MWDLAITGGTVVDGTGAPGRRADVAVADGRITGVGPDVGPARRVIDAAGCIVTPGFVDPHTHYDGQATWDAELAPSSGHGVTSAVMGNCGVGFAPVEADRHDWLIGMMEGVEDIPGTALAEGLTWDWRSYPEYLDALDRQPRAIDVGSQVPHAALRAFVMGEPGADPAAVPSDDELAAMHDHVAAGIDAGALGVSTSRTEAHLTAAGDHLGTLRAQERELLALASALAGRGRGVFQLLTDAYQTPDDDLARRELDLVSALARSGRPVSLTVQQSHHEPQRWRQLLDHIEGLAAAGHDVKAQVAPRPIGILMGLPATTSPWNPCRDYRRVASLPVAERAAALREPERRAAILASHERLTGGPEAFAGLRMLGRLSSMWVLSDPVDYRLQPERTVTALAAQAGVDPRAYLYDLLAAGEGRQLVYMPFFNFAGGDMGVVREMLTSPAAMYGLSDAGAHCGSICDASTTTSYLTMWARDAGGDDAIPLEAVVHQLTRRPAAHVGWLDRGVVAPGYLADLNVIDLPALACRPPEVVNDLPAGGRRLVQGASGYRATVKAGTVTFSDGEATGALPGTLVRGPRPAPA